MPLGISGVKWHRIGGSGIGSFTVHRKKGGNYGTVFGGPVFGFFTVLLIKLENERF